MTKNFIKKYRFCMYMFFFIVIFILERLTKVWALQYVAYKDIVICPYIRFGLLFNRGISWSLFVFNSFWLQVVFYLIILLTIALFTVYTISEYNNKKNIIGELLVLIGATSNFIDRLFFVGVIDFIDCFWGLWHWPTFNIADVLIVGGVICILIKIVYGAKNGYTRIVG